MGVASLLWIAVTAGVAGVAVLRFSWGRPARSWGLNAAGWTLLVAGSVTAALAEGAWGLSVMALFAMGAAMAVLTVAGARSPRGRNGVSNRRVGMLPEAGEPRRIGRRLGTFGLVIGAGFVVSVGLAVAVRGLGGLLGWSEANSNALALFVAPLVWAVLATALLMQTSRRQQVATLALCCLPLVPVLVGGALA